MVDFLVTAFDFLVSAWLSRLVDVWLFMNMVNDSGWFNQDLVELG